MSEQHPHCQHPEQLKGKVGECSREQIAICHGLDESHPRETPTDQELLENFRKKEGFIPKPLVFMSKRPGLLRKFVDYAKTVFEGGPLNNRERFLIAVSVATALKSADCMQAHSKRALNAGATQEEVWQAVLIAGMMANTSSLHGAYDAVVGEPL